MSAKPPFIAIAIDGPAASGKSTVAKRLATDLELIMVNSGAMYRAITWAVLEHGLDSKNHEQVATLLEKLSLTCSIRNGESIILVDGRELDEELRGERVNLAVSDIASIPKVRDLLVMKQREFLQLGNLVMEGRDIGTVVFPDTPFKFYIEASEEVRAARRAADGEGDAVAVRDKKDSERKMSPLRMAEDAMRIDSSDITIDEVVSLVKQELKQKGFNF